MGVQDATARPWRTWIKGHSPPVGRYVHQRAMIPGCGADEFLQDQVEAGTVVLALVLDTLSGRSPLSRLEAFFAQQDTALLLGKTVPPQALNDDTAGPGPRSPLRLWHHAALHGLCGPGCHTVGLGAPLGAL